MGRAVEPLINDHPVYWSLGNTPFERQAAYRHLFEHDPSDDELATIRRSTHGGWLLGRRRCGGPGDPEPPSGSPQGRPPALTEHDSVPD